MASRGTTPQSEHRVVFDLGTAQRPKDQGNAEPFVAHLPAQGDYAERDVIFTDPATLSWQQLLEIDHPVQFIRYCVSDEDRDYLRDYPMEGWQFNELIKSFHRHYKLPLPEQARNRL